MQMNWELWKALQDPVPELILEIILVKFEFRRNGMQHTEKVHKQ